MISRYSKTLLVASALLFAGGCHSANSVPNEGPTVATVNGIPIGKDRVDMIIKQHVSQGQPDTPAVRTEIINNLATQILASEDALKKGLDKTPEVSDQLDLARRSILANAFVQDYIKNHPVSDDAIKAQYEKFKAQMGGTEYKARHILVGSEAEAKDIIAKLKKNPKAFDALAKAKSKDPGSKNKGGELGWFDPHNMVPEFGEAVAKLKKGEMTDTPVKSQFGYHIILLEDSRQKELPPMEQVKQMLTQQVQQQDLRKLLDDMKAKAKIDIKSPAPEAAAAPGFPATPAPASSAASASASAPASASASASAAKK